MNMATTAQTVLRRPTRGLGIFDVMNGMTINVIIGVKRISFRMVDEQRAEIGEV